MDNYTVVFVTDKRQEYLSEFLPGRIASGLWVDEESENICIGQMQRATTIVLPTPASKVSRTVDLSEILKHNLKSCTRVFGGKISQEWKEWFAAHNMECFDFMEDEQVALENAYVTAEGAVAEILKASKYAIRGQKMIVTGYGRCGRCVANLLAAMGAKVTVLARSVANRKQAKADGHNAVDFSYGPEEAYGTRTFVNTVPACVLGRNIIAEMHKDAIVIDLASAPGGTDCAAAKEYGITVIPALGLPAIYTTKSSAKIMADAILRQTSHKNGVGEDKSWIFQIII